VNTKNIHSAVGLLLPNMGPLLNSIATKGDWEVVRQFVNGKKINAGLEWNIKQVSLPVLGG